MNVPGRKPLSRPDDKSPAENGSVLRLAAAILLLAAAVAAPAQRLTALEPVTAAEPRVALVIGNAKYRQSPLANPVNDAEDMSETLRLLGFKVLLVRDANTREMRQAIREMAGELRRAKVGLFYYAGHGVQLRGSNYLIPVGVDLESEADVEDMAIDATYVLRTMEETQVDVSIVILDACRNNPFARSFRSQSRGLAQMTAAKGTVIAFSTAPGHEAADGTSRNGTYTKHLLENLRASDSDILKVFQRTRAGVVRETAGKQTPWESTSLVGDFHFRAGAATQIASAAPSTTSVPVPARPDGDADSPIFLEQLDAFLKGHPAPLTELQRLAGAGNRLSKARLCAAGTHERFNVGLRAEDALSHCRQLADAGDAVGLYLYGRAHMYGRGTAVDDARAVALFRQASRRGRRWR